jgi:glycosyltransferase involved in cell wall biosynthesis
MNLLHLILTKEFAGSERYACQLASLQAQSGHTVTLLVNNANPEYVGRIVTEAAPARVVTIPRWWPSALHSWAILWAVKKLKPVLIHTHLGRAAKRTAQALAWLGLRGKGMRPKHVSTLHLEYRPDYAATDGLICIAGWQKAGIPSTYKGTIKTIWNWATPRPKNAPEVKTGFTFLSVGRLVPQKGMDILIQAFRHAFAGGDEVSLVIAGDGPDRAKLEALAAADPRITLLGYVPQVDALYPAAKVYVSAARYEPFGLTILEAMQSGCRLVCTRTQGPSEFLAKFNPHWADVDDVKSLAQALKSAAKSPKTRIPWDMSAFSSKKRVNDIIRFYQSLVASRPADEQIVP